MKGRIILQHPVCTATAHVSDEAKEHLKTVHNSLNAFMLKRNIEKKLRVIFKKVKVALM